MNTELSSSRRKGSAIVLAAALVDWRSDRGSRHVGAFASRAEWQCTHRFGFGA